MRDDALVIDLSLLRSTTVSPQDHTVRVDAGATWGDVDHATVAFGMATPSGFIASTGVAGLTLGGGTGYLTRRFGLTVDNLLSADVVLADGRFVTASESSNSDLFWALRGGGGNFGIVTSFTFRCHDIGEAGTIIGGPVLYDLADTPEVMRWYRELLPSLPEELNGWIALLTIPPAPPFPEALWGRKACGIVWCYTGPHDRAEEVLEPVRSFGSPLVVGLQPMPFTALQSAFDPLYPAGLQWYWRADFFNEISDAAIDVHVKYGAQLPTGHSTMHLYPIDGAASRVPANATAFAYRDGGYNGIIAGVDPDPANAGLISRWVKDYWEELHPTSAGGAYVNFLMDEGQGPGQGLLPRQLRPAGPGQAPVRPGQHLPRQPEHPAARPARRLARPGTKEARMRRHDPRARTGSGPGRDRAGHGTALRAGTPQAGHTARQRDSVIPARRFRGRRRAGIGHGRDRRRRRGVRADRPLPGRGGCRVRRRRGP